MTWLGRLVRPVGRAFRAVGRGFAAFGRGLRRLGRRLFPRRVLIVLAVLVVLGGIVTGAVLSIRNLPTAPAASSGTPSGTAILTSSEEPEPSADEETSDPFPTGDPPDSLDPSFDPSDPSAGGLPGDLVPNAVEDECLLTAAEFELLTGERELRAENTELAGDGRRSCFYGADDADEPAGRIDVYSSASLSPPQLVTRIAAGGAGARALAGVGSGAALVTGTGGTAELVVASPTLLVVLTLLTGDTAAPPSDEALTAAGAAMLTRLPG
ncbi:MAG TPA: hypothetical protein VGD67_05670 [Pseudonocardiaceae bacterium]